MSEAKINVIYACKNCGAKGTLIEKVNSVNFKDLKKLPCGCPAENGKFQFLHPLS